MLAAAAALATPYFVDLFDMIKHRGDDGSTPAERDGRSIRCRRWLMLMNCVRELLICW